MHREHTALKLGSEDSTLSGAYLQAYRPKFDKHPTSTPFIGDRPYLAHVFYESLPSR